MAPKRKYSKEIWRLHKKFKATEASASVEVQDNLPGTPPTEPESSTAQIIRDAIEDFKKSATFEDILATSGSQYFAKGFCACRNWIGHMIPQLGLSHQCINTIPPRHCHLPLGYLEQVEESLNNKIWDEAEFVAHVRAAEAHNEEVKEEVMVVVEDMEVVEAWRRLGAVEEVRDKGSSWQTERTKMMMMRKKDKPKYNENE